MSPSQTATAASPVKTLPPGPGAPAILQMYRWYRGLPGFLDNARRRYGDTFTVRAPVLGTHVMFSDPEDLRVIFAASGDRFDDGGPAALFPRTSGPDSIASLTGEAHRQARRTLGPSLQISARNGQIMRDAVRRAVAEAPRGEPLPLRGFLNEISLEILARIVAGVAPGPETRELGGALQDIGHPLVGAVLAGLGLARGASRGRRRADAIVDAWITDRLAAPERDEAEDLLDVLLHHLGGAAEEHRHVIRGRLFSILVGAHGAFISVVGWALPYVLRDPEIRLRIDEEIAAGGNADDGSGFDYLDATIMEVLRLRPLVPLIFRRPVEPFPVRDRVFPAGVTLTPAVYLVHRREDLYPQPSEFRPERFLGHTPDPCHWLPFGGGFRRCLGLPLAMQELRVALAVLLGESGVELDTPPALDAERDRKRLGISPADRVRIRFPGGRGTPA